MVEIIGIGRCEECISEHNLAASPSDKPACESESQCYSLRASTYANKFNLFRCPKRLPFKVAVQWSQGCLHPKRTGPSFFARYISYEGSADSRNWKSGKFAQKTTLKLLVALQSIYIGAGPIVVQSSQSQKHEQLRNAICWVQTGWTCTGWSLSLLDIVRLVSDVGLTARRQRESDC